MQTSEKTMVNGHPMLFDVADTLNLGAAGEFEPEVVQFFRAAISPGDIVVDVGANFGIHTLEFARLVGPKGHVFAFEPHPNNYDLLQHNVANNSYHNVTLLQKAVSDKAGTARLHVSSDNAGMHRLYESALCEGGAVDVECVRLDTFFSADQRVNFIKIDVEGKEHSVIAGARGLLERQSDFVLIAEFAVPSLWEAGSDPFEFLNELNRHDVHWFEFKDGKTLVPLSVSDLRRQLWLISKDRQQIMAKAGAQGLAASDRFQIVQDWLAKVGYARPLVENLVCVKGRKVRIM